MISEVFKEGLKEIFYFKDSPVYSELAPSRFVTLSTPQYEFNTAIHTAIRGFKRKVKLGEISKEETQAELESAEAVWNRLYKATYIQDLNKISIQDIYPELERNASFTRTSFRKLLGLCYGLLEKIIRDLHDILSIYFVDLSLLGLEGDKEEVTRDLYQKSKGGVSAIAEMFSWKATPQGFSFWAELYLNSRDDQFISSFRGLLKQINPKLY